MHTANLNLWSKNMPKRAQNVFCFSYELPNNIFFPGTIIPIRIMTFNNKNNNNNKVMWLGKFFPSLYNDGEREEGGRPIQTSKILLLQLYSKSSVDLHGIDFLVSCIW